MGLTYLGENKKNRDISSRQKRVVRAFTPCTIIASGRASHIEPLPDVVYRSEFYTDL